MMVIKKWVTYYYQVVFKCQIVSNQLQYWFDLLKIVTYAQPKKIIWRVSNHAIVTRVFDTWKQHFDKVQHPMQSQQWQLINVHVQFQLYSWYFTVQHGTNMWHTGLLSPTCFNRQFFIIKWIQIQEYDFSIMERTYLYIRAGWDIWRSPWIK